MMASTVDNDPFLQAQSDILSVLNTTRPLLASYLRIRSSASSSNSPELVEARNELESVLGDLKADLEDLVETVKAVELDPYSFGLQIEEVRRRRNLVEEVGEEVENMRAELRKTVDRAAASHGVSGQDYLPDPESFEDDDDYAAAFEQQRQQEIMREQDEQLDSTFRTVGNLREQGLVMGRELEEQAQLLEETDTLADRVGGKLQVGMKSLSEVIRRNEDTWSSCCIAVLIIVLIILLVILLAI